MGIQGLAPYFFEIEPTFYFRDGAVAGRFEGLYNLYITQRLILQPQIELNFFGTRDPGRGIGTGLSNLDGGVRLGYQISRKFAPYVGFTYTGTYGETAIFAQRGGQLTHAARLAFWNLGVAISVRRTNRVLIPRHAGSRLQPHLTYYSCAA